MLGLCSWLYEQDRTPTTKDPGCGLGEKSISPDGGEVGVTRAKSGADNPLIKGWLILAQSLSPEIRPNSKRASAHVLNSRKKECRSASGCMIGLVRSKGRTRAKRLQLLAKLAISTEWRFSISDDVNVCRLKKRDKRVTRSCSGWPILILSLKK